MALDIHATTFFIRETDWCLLKWEVLYLDEDRKGLRVKAATIQTPYDRTYGPDVYATYNGTFWSKGSVSLALMQDMMHLFAHRTIDLNILDTSSIKER